MASEFGKRLRAAREHAGLTQPELARRVGVAQSTISAAESTGDGSRHTVQLAGICGVNAEWLATGEGSMLGGVRAEEPAPMFRKVALRASEIRTVSAPRIGWEELERMESLPDEFYMQVPDDALAPSAPTGTSLRFTKASSARPGQAALLRTSDGRHHVREIHLLANGSLVGKPTNHVYPSIDLSVGSGSEVLAVVSGIEADWSQFRK